MRKEYSQIRKQYPEYVSKIQLYQICGISPRSASYLLENGIIPAIDTGKPTWRWRIKLDDVIAYLKKREKRGSMIPPGAVSSRYQRPTNRKSFASLVSPGQEDRLAEYFLHIYTDYPDVLTAADIAEMTGFSKETVFRLIRKGTIKTISVNGEKRYFIPKPFLIDYLKSPAFIESKSSSAVFNKILGGFELWIAAK